MKRWIVYILFGPIILAACNHTGSNNNTSAVQITKTAVKPFSDSLQADTFIVKLLGNNPGEMHLDFTIKSFEGKQIYGISIKAKDLFKNYDATLDLDKKSNQLKFLQDEMNRFFDEENFLEPAITEQEIPDEHVPDKFFYDELKKSRLNGFIYRLGKENKLYIGWSAKEKKVQPYYNCCK